MKHLFHCSFLAPQAIWIHLCSTNNRLQIWSRPTPKPLQIKLNEERVTSRLALPYMRSFFSFIYSCSLFAKRCARNPFHSDCDLRTFTNVRVSQNYMFKYTLPYTLDHVCCIVRNHVELAYLFFFKPSFAQTILNTMASISPVSGCWCDRRKISVHDKQFQLTDTIIFYYYSVLQN